MKAKDVERFWSHVQKGEGCWYWVSSKNPKGYGLFWVDGKYQVATRFIYSLLRGTIGCGLLVCHTCDNPSCVRPDHLFLGTSLDNNRDAKRKGRTAKGERHGSKTHPERVPSGERNGRRTKPESYARLYGEMHHKAKLTVASVQEIRTRYNAGETNKAALAREYLVGETTIRDVINRRIWRDV